MTNGQVEGDPLTPPGGRWRLGALSLIAVVAVVVGMLAFGGEEEPSIPTLPSGLQPSSGAPRQGEPAPDFAVTTFDGSRFSLSEHLANDGRPVMLNLWASWCPPCRAEMPVFDRVAADRDDVLIVGVAVDDALAPAEAFAGEVGVRYPLAFDADGSVAAAYPTPGLPATFTISSDGRVVSIAYGELEENEMRALMDEAG